MYIYGSKKKKKKKKQKKLDYGLIASQIPNLELI